MAWAFLVVAGLLEIVWAIAMKQSNGFSKLVPSLVFGVAAIASFLLLARALRDLPVGTGYAVWTGIGAVGAAIIGIVWMAESAAPMRLVSIGLVAAGIIGLALTSAAGN